VVFVPATAVGAIGTPVKTGLDVTKAVVATYVVFVPGAWVRVVRFPDTSRLPIAKFEAWIAPAWVPVTVRLVTLIRPAEISDIYLLGILYQYFN
jgi:hypothetical protein